MAGFGLNPWGLGAFGGGPGDLSIAAAYPTGDRRMFVRLTRAPYEGTPDDDGSVFNPRTWSVLRLDQSLDLRVVRVEAAGQYSYELACLLPLGSHNVSHSVHAAGLRLSAGGAFLSGAAFAVRGTLAEEERRHVTSQPRRRGGPQDLLNQDVPGGMQVGGTLVIDASGDYARMSGPALVKKLILRRLITRAGEFFHLPKYGIGLRVKEPLPGSDLVGLKKEIEDQVRLEPEVQECTCRLTQSENLLLVDLKVKLRKTGAVLEFPIRLTPNAVTF